MLAFHFCLSFLPFIFAFQFCLSCQPLVLCPLQKHEVCLLYGQLLCFKYTFQVTRRCLSICVECISAAVKVIHSRLLGLMEHRLDRPGFMCGDAEQWLSATQLLFSRMVGVRH